MSGSGQSQMLGSLLGWGVHVPHVLTTGGSTRREGLSTPSGSFPDCSPQAEVSTFLRCFHHALYYATMAANPWTEAFFS